MSSSEQNASSDHDAREAIDTTVRVLLDESGNNDGQALLMVGALTTDRDFADLEARVAEAFEDLSARNDLQGMASFEHFLRTGFHAAEDPREVQQAFVDDISTWLGFKIFLLCTDRTRQPELDEPARQLELYRRLLRDVVLRFRHAQRIELMIEENEQLRPLLSSLVRAVSDAAGQQLRSSAPSLSATMVSKRDPHALAILDYVMAICSRWIKAGRPVDPQAWAYRQFRAIEPAVSVLFSMELGLISNRRHRVG